MKITLKWTFWKNSDDSIDRSILGIIMLVLVALGLPPAYAAIPVPGTMDNDHISSATTVACEGTVGHSGILAWQQSGTSLHDPPLDTGGFLTVWFDEGGNPIYGWTADPTLAELFGMPVPPGEIRYTAGYNAFILTGRGTTELAKNMVIDYGDGKDNLDTMTQLGFTPANDQDHAIFYEDLMIDGAAAHTTGANAISCQFSADNCPFIPPFCAVVEMGSRSIISQGSAMTKASSVFSSDSYASGVSMDYSVTSGDFTLSNDQQMTTGSIDAYIYAHMGDGRMINITPSYPGDFQDIPAGYIPVKSSEITYLEKTSANGLIRMFSKDMHYRSGVTG